MAIQVFRGFDPAEKSTDVPIDFGSEKEIADRALTALFELRGEMRMKPKKDGSFVAVKSGLNIKPAKDIYAVPIIHRKSGEVRHVDLSEGTSDNPNAPAPNHMKALLQGQWRFASEEEQKAALAKEEAERAALKAIKQRNSAEGQADLIGQKIGEQLSQFAEVVSAKKAKV